jgi:hypothetical protein
MDELLQAVAPFYPGGGGVPGVPLPPPGEPEMFTALTPPEENQKPPAENNGFRFITNDAIEALKKDNTLCRTFKNCLLRQEQLVHLVKGILLEKGVHVESVKDVSSGVENYLADAWQLDPAKRNKTVSGILKDVWSRRANSCHYNEILDEILDIDKPGR